MCHIRVFFNLYLKVIVLMNNAFHSIAIKSYTYKKYCYKTHQITTSKHSYTFFNA